MPFEHVRHRPPRKPRTGWELVVACVPMRSHVNLSRIVRAASCFGVSRVIATGAAKLEQKIARDGADEITFQVHRTLPPVLERLANEGYSLIGLEQTTDSSEIYSFSFPKRTVLVVGNERTGLNEEILSRLHAVVEIPVYGLPHSHNAASATIIGMYEFCRQRNAGPNMGKEEFSRSAE